MLYLGLISGTSMDAVDAALVDFRDGACKLASYRQYPFPDRLRATLKSISADTPVVEIERCDGILGELFADCALDLVRSAGASWSDVVAIGCHGQTVLHLPEPGVWNTLQIGDANRIAWRTGVTTISDFRRMDMAAGGHGAPLAPAFHEFAFRIAAANRVVLNIGGIANITVLPADPGTPVSGFDTGPGNTLLDQWIAAHRGEAYDRDGLWAAGGACDIRLLDRMLADDYFTRLPPKSTGKELFNLGWLKDRLASDSTSRNPRDVQATLAELTARSVGDAIRSHAPAAGEVLVCGGGIHNQDVMRRLRDALPRMKVESTAKYGIDPDAVEAMTFAWLAKRRMEGLPGNLPSVTGASRAVMLGAIHDPGRPGSRV